MAMSNIEKAKFRYYYSMPFFAHLMTNLKIVEVDKEFFGGRTSLGGVSKRNLYIIPEELEKLPIPQIIRFFAHETMHLFMDHLNRVGDKDHMLYNIAGDYALECILEEEKIGERIPGALHDMQYKGLTTEEIYHGLQSGKYPMPKGFNPDFVIEPGDGSGEGSGRGFSEEELKGMIAGAANVARMAGKAPGGQLAKLIEELLEPKLPWEHILRRFFKARIKTKQDWMRPNKNYMVQGIVVPSKGKDPGLNEIVVIYDESGSISDRERQAYNSELIGIFKQVRPEKIHVIHWDTRLIEEKTVKKMSDIETKTFNGGGTDMCASVVYAREQYPKAKACVVLTDGYTDWTKVPNPNDVLWVITTNQVSGSGGKTINMKLD